MMLLYEYIPLLVGVEKPFPGWMYLGLFLKTWGLLFMLGSGMEAVLYVLWISTRPFILWRSTSPLRGDDADGQKYGYPVMKVYVRGVSKYAELLGDFATLISGEDPRCDPRAEKAVPYGSPTQKV